MVLEFINHSTIYIYFYSYQFYLIIFSYFHTKANGYFNFILSRKALY